MKRLLPYLKYFRPVKWYFVGGVVAGLVYAAASGAGLPLAAKAVFPLIFEPEPGEVAKEANWFVDAVQGFFGELERGTLVLLACAWLPVVFFFRAVGGFFNGYWINYCGFRFVEQLREEVFEKLQGLPISFFREHQSGDLLARLVGDAELLRQTLSQAAEDVIKQPATLVAALGVLFYLAFTTDGTALVLLAILSIPVCVIPLRMIAKKLGRRAKSLQESAGDLSGQIAETLQAPMEVRAYQLEEAVMTRFRAKLGEIVKYSMKVVKYRQLTTPAVEVVAVAGLSVAIYVGSKQEMKLTEFMTIAFALYMSYEPIKKLAKVHNLLKQSEAAIGRLEGILEADDDLPDPAVARVPADFLGEIEYRGVGLSYGAEPVLRGIDLKIRAGECVALIGPSGCGKSSLFHLIPRFYEATEGAVLVGGQDVREWRKSDLRGKIALVSQSPVLFQGTIRENILLGRPGASEAEVVQAAKRAHAHEFILKQEAGYDTMVAEMGQSLSGGQRQRIAIARAFLRDAPILLLDEATSALDNESEALIQEELRELIRGRTTILIAHRLSTTRIADRVVELDQGMIVSERAEV